MHRLCQNCFVAMRRSNGLGFVALLLVGHYAWQHFAFTPFSRPRWGRHSSPRCCGRGGYCVARSRVCCACGSGTVGDNTGTEDFEAAQWAALQAERDGGDAAGHDSSSLAKRAAALLEATSLDRLRSWVTPVETLQDLELHGDPVKALQGLLGKDSHLVTDSLSESSSMNMAHEAFFQAEMYLKRLQPMQSSLPTMEPSQPSMREVQTELNDELTQTIGTTPEMDDALDNSLLLARLNFHSTVRFGYFIQRCRRRVSLERLLRGLVQPPSIEDYLSEMAPPDVVELVRPASEEVVKAMELRTSKLFGDMLTLLTEVGSRPDDITALDVSPWMAERLTVEAAAFGAALFEAEEAARRHYDLHETPFASRDQTA